MAKKYQDTDEYEWLISEDTGDMVKVPRAGNAQTVALPAVYSGPSLYEQYLRENPIQAKPTYADSYSGQMADLYGKITGRGPFRYDATKDPLYQGMKDQYIRGGKMAMKDTMGQAAALTGGYANTYGQQVGQQAYDAYLQNLTEVIPTLYGMAYDQYKDAGDQLMQQYGLLGDLRDQEYGRYRDELSDWNAERAYLAGLENEDYRRRTQAEQLQYSREQDAYNRQWQEENRSYSRQQDAYANLYAAIKASGYVPSDSELAAAGMSRAAADAIAAEYQRGVDMDERNMSLRENSAYSSGGGSSGGSSGRSYGGGGGYTDNVLGKTVTYGGDIWSDSQQQYRDYGYQTTTNDLNRAWNSGKITTNQYVTGQTAADILWTIDHATNVANAAVAKQNTSKTKTAGEDWNEIRKRLGI